MRKHKYLRYRRTLEILKLFLIIIWILLSMIERLTCLGIKEVVIARSLKEGERSARTNPVEGPCC